MKSQEGSLDRKSKPRSVLEVRRELVFRLALAADGHVSSVAPVVGVSSQAANAMLRGTTIGARWRAYRRFRAVQGLRASWLRNWWRHRLKNIGVDPLTLPVTDPLWSACYARPRGALFRDVVAQLRRELPEGAPLFEHADEIIERVARLKALSEAEQRAALGIVGVPRDFDFKNV